MERVSFLERALRTVLIVLVLVFFLFPIFWIVLMSFQNNDQILRIPPSILFEPTLANYTTLLTGKLQTTAGNLDIAFLRSKTHGAVTFASCYLPRRSDLRFALDTVRRFRAERAARVSS